MPNMAFDNVSPGAGNPGPGLCVHAVPAHNCFTLAHEFLYVPNAQRTACMTLITESSSRSTCASR